MKIFIVNGYPQAGKTTFESYVISRTKNKYKGTILSTIDPIKEIAYICGWNGEKTPRDRKFLSQLKDLTTEWTDYPFTWIQSHIENISEEDQEAIVFIDCREPFEIDRLKTEYSTIAKTVLIQTQKPQDITNHADDNVNNYEYDIVIPNHTPILTTYFETIEEFITEYL